MTCISKSPYIGGSCDIHNKAFVYSPVYIMEGMNFERECAATQGGRIVKVRKKVQVYGGVLWRCPVKYCKQKWVQLDNPICFRADVDSKGRPKRGIYTDVHVSD